MSFFISNSELDMVVERRARAARTFLLSFAVIVVLGIGSLWILAVKGRAGFLDPEYGMWVAKSHMIADCRLGSTLVIGDSRAVAAFVPALIGNDMTNLALGGATPIEFTFASRKILACPKKPQLVIISFSLQQLTEGFYFWNRTALFGFLSFDELEHVRKEARSIGDTTIYPPANLGDADAIVANWLYAHHFPSYYMSSMINGRIVGRLSLYYEIQKKVETAGGHMSYGMNNGTDVPAGDAEYNRFRPSPLINAYFHKLIALYEISGTEVLYVPAPISDATYAHLRPGVISAATDYLRDLAAQYGNFHLAGPAIVHYPNRYFGDPQHLNDLGAATFSRSVAAELQKRA